MARVTRENAPEGSDTQMDGHDPYSGFVIGARQRAAALDTALLDPFVVFPMQGEIAPFQKASFKVTYHPAAEASKQGFKSTADLYATCPALHLILHINTLHLYREIIYEENKIQQRAPRIHSLYC